MNPFGWVQPKSVGEAIGLLGDGAIAKAGGVDLMDLLKERLISPERLVNLRGIPGLDRVVAGEAGLRVGPLVTLAQLAADTTVKGGWPALADAAGHAATPQIRNMATAGGNLVQRPRCWYFRQEAFHCKKKGGARCFAQDGENAYHAIFDNGTCAAVHPSALGVALVALGGSVEVTSAKGAREVALEAFFRPAEAHPFRENVLAQGELVTELRVPRLAQGATCAYEKQGEKGSFDWPLVEVAVLLEREGDRCKRAVVALGGVAHAPYRARGAETALEGKALSDDVLLAAARAATTGASPLRDNGYKIPMAQAVVRRTLLAALKGGAR